MVMLLLYREHIVMMMGSLLSWNVSEKLSVELLAPPSCKASYLILAFREKDFCISCFVSVFANAIFFCLIGLKGSIFLWEGVSKWWRRH